MTYTTANGKAKHISNKILITAINSKTSIKIFGFRFAKTNCTLLVNETITLVSMIVQCFLS